MQMPQAVFTTSSKSGLPYMGEQKRAWAASARPPVRDAVPKVNPHNPMDFKNRRLSSLTANLNLP